jgi:hypothetical protein
LGGTDTDLTPGDFKLFEPIKESIGKKFKTDDEFKSLVQRWLDEQPQTFLTGA